MVLSSETLRTASIQGNKRLKGDLTGFLIVLGVGLAGIDRVDFFGGGGAFRLTPFLLLSTPLMLLALYKLWVNHSVVRPEWLRPFVALCMLLGIGLVSALVNDVGPMSLGRLALFYVTAVGVLSLLVVAVAEERASAVRTGALLGLAIYITLSLLENGQIQFLSFISESQFYSGGNRIFGIVGDRQSGGSLDPNRGAVCVIVYIYLLLGDPYTRRRYHPAIVLALIAVGGVFVVQSLSRTGILLFLLLLVPILRYVATVMRPVQAGVFYSVVGSMSIWYALTAKSATGLSLVDLLVDRLSLDDGSAREHFELQDVAFKTMGSDDGLWLYGGGFGNSYMFVSDFFGGSAYGNFHSFLLTVLVELGLGGLLICVYLSFGRLAEGRALLVLATFAIGIYYQMIMDPVFWIMILIPWVFPCGKKGHLRIASANNWNGGQRICP